MSDVDEELSGSEENEEVESDSTNSSAEGATGESSDGANGMNDDTIDEGAGRMLEDTIDDSVSKSDAKSDDDTEDKSSDVGEAENAEGDKSDDAENAESESDAEDEASESDADDESDPDDADDEPSAEDQGPVEADDEPSRAGIATLALEDGLIECRYYGTTDVGLIREHNEDNLVTVDMEAEVRGPAPDDENESRATIVGERGLVLAVCDGMGGAAAGEVASQMAVDTIHEVMQAGGVARDRDMFAHRLVFAVEEAGARIFSSAKMDRSKRGMGTTATAAGLIDRFLFVGQVGDSRCYILREGVLTLITKDQSLVNQLIEAGQLTEEEAEAFEHSNIILQALGTTEEVSVDLTFVELRRGDRIMLCSDGLSGLVHAEMIQEVMAETENQEDVARQLIELANAGGGHDNITCIVADFEGDGLQPVDDTVKPSYMQYPLPPPEAVMGHSVPPREPTMKSSVRKPGADVKRGTGEVRATSGDDGEGSLWPIALVCVLVVIVIGYFMMKGDGETVDEGETTTVVPVVLPDPEPEVDEVEAVALTVHTDIAGAELFVDDVNHGPLDYNFDNEVELPPGAYTVEARVAGSAIASQMVTLRDAMRIDLMMPVGVDTEGEDEALPVEDETTEEEIEPPSEPPTTPTPMTATPTPMTTTPTPMTTPMRTTPTPMTTPAPMTATPTPMTTTPPAMRALRPEGGTAVPENPF